MYCLKGNRFIPVIHMTMGCSSSVGLNSKPIRTERAVLPNIAVTINIREKHLIKKTWKSLSRNMPEIGAKIFLLIFTKYPHIKQIFHCRDVTGDALLKDTHFRGHASRFMQAVGAAVDNIDDLDTAMAPLLFGLGQQHIHYKGFEMDYFDAFVEAIMHVFGNELGAKFNAEVSQAWLIVFQFIQKTLKDGYTDASQNSTIMSTNT